MSILSKIFGWNKSVILLMIMLFISVLSIKAEKFNACQDDSIWGAFTIDQATGEVVNFYYAEDFFTENGGMIPGFDTITDPYIVPKFIFNSQSCDVDSFEVYFRFSNKENDLYWTTITTQTSIWFTTREEYEIDFDDVLKGKTTRKQHCVTAIDSGPQKDGLRGYESQRVMWFKYKDGVITKSSGGTANYNICTLDRLDLSWDIVGGMINYMRVKINDKVYEEDFTDCTNAMKYDPCPPKEPDFIKVICEEVPDCRSTKYRFYTESNLGEINWYSKDGLSHMGTSLTIDQEEFNGGCIAVWAQKDPCTPPVYDTICPPLIEIKPIEVDLEESVCWNEPFYIDGKRVMESGVYEKQYTTEDGCDSIVRFRVNVSHADTTITDTIYRCGIKHITNSTYITDTVEVEGACPDLQMSPLGRMSNRHHVSIEKIKDEHDEVSVGVFNNVGNVKYITMFMGKDTIESIDGSLVFDKAGPYKIVAYDEETGCKDSTYFYYATPIKPDRYFDPENSEDFTWDVIGIDKYSHYRIYIYDRFGKELVTYENEFNGWDGIYNGHRMPSTDYWYSIEVDEADISMHGHFTLIRLKK